MMTKTGRENRSGRSPGLWSVNPVTDTARPSKPSTRANMPRRGAGPECKAAHAGQVARSISANSASAIKRRPPEIARTRERGPSPRCRDDQRDDRAAMIRVLRHRACSERLAQQRDPRRPMPIRTMRFVQCGFGEPCAFPEHKVLAASEQCSAPDARTRSAPNPKLRSRPSDGERISRRPAATRSTARGSCQSGAGPDVIASSLTR